MSTYIGEDDEGSVSDAPEDPIDLGAPLFVGLVGAMGAKPSTTDSDEASLSQRVVQSGFNFALKSYLKKLLLIEGI